ncbi:trans-aconitate 2-methyltransferase [Catenuloplanes atrovinosus]|uniref:Trans-aconitate 2-methyltransferase n=1 Tax=Catenuloplanes atrovinosus TaxID=137266 RepID=A0AAE3YKE0_9ACTN|nr:trans-aconitate 2-methyltransferase [Catenuloplanes atrovinosus]MDR7274075.1 trans-aconitate 2-methyltransferase [Catenuloplanes atrovinosus]
MWDPDVYQRYGDERSRPFFDLVGRVPVDAPRRVVDLGCGPGDLTATLARRWPSARVEGVDSSAEMIAKASALGAPVAFAVGDVRSWQPAPDVDVLVSNAVLQWVPGHEELLPRWAASVAPGGVIALQVPGNFGAPSHRALQELAASPRWADALNGVGLIRRVPDFAAYGRIFARLGCAVDAWATTYLHPLPAADGAEHPVLRWMDGTALRPVKAALPEADWPVFRTALGERLAEAYPVENGLVFFPFHRNFVVARTPEKDARA